MVIMHAAHVGEDVDIAQIMRMFENGAFDERRSDAKRRRTGTLRRKQNLRTSRPHRFRFPLLSAGNDACARVKMVKMSTRWMTFRRSRGKA